LLRLTSLLVKIDEKGEFVPYTKEIQFNTNGEHTIEAKSIDKVGNVSSIATYTVFVDTLPPDSKIDAVTE
jgi:hypothetical protein